MPYVKKEDYEARERLINQMSENEEKVKRQRRYLCIALILTNAGWLLL